MEEPDFSDDEGHDLGWGFFYPPDLVRRGLVQWYNNDFRHMPSPQDLLMVDPKWEQDLTTMRQIIEHKKPKDKKGDG